MKQAASAQLLGKSSCKERKTMKRLALALFFCTLLVPLGIWAQAPSAGDAYVASSAPTTNYGTNTILAVQNGVTSFVQFNLSAIPPGSK